MANIGWVITFFKGAKLLIIILGLILPFSIRQVFVQKNNHTTSSLNRASFPHGFIFGVASSAYQYEGAVKEDGRGPSMWDAFILKYPDKIKDGSNGDVAVDSYHRYKEDVKIIKEIGLDAYRFSMSWSRILPKGKLSGGINWKGIEYYNNLINELLKNGIQPFVTLFHGDIPQALEDEYGGFLSEEIVNDFKDYAELCYKEFGDRVKHWMTTNEPLFFDLCGYGDGSGPPGRCSKWLPLNCTAGDSGIEPYIVAHNVLLAHAAAATLYKQIYQEHQKGKVGIVAAGNWYIPLSSSTQDHEATQRLLDFTIGWFMEPLTRGKYPDIMRSRVKDRLPKFTREQSIMIKGSFDFIGFNYYSSVYAMDPLPSSSSIDVSRLTYADDVHANTTNERHGIPIGPKGATDGFNIYPKGIRDVLIYVKKKYNLKEIYVTENGISELNNSSLSLKEALVDTKRIEFHHHHLYYVREAIKNGVDVRGYFAWSLLDDFEWAEGYTVRFGLNFVDYENGLKRYPKRSSLWFKKFLEN